MRFAQPYSDEYVGTVAGTVEGVDGLEGSRQGLPYVAFAEDYADDYVGPVHGQWKNVTDPALYRVEVYSVSDAPYLQGSYDLQADGTWSSGEEIARGGGKVAKLVRVSDGLTVARSGDPETTVSDVAVDLYSRTDADYLQQEVPLAGDGRFRSTVALARGTKIARLVNLRTGRVLNSTEWTDAPSYQGLVRSFDIPQDDPDYGYAPGVGGYRLDQRSFIYDDALAVLSYLDAGQEDRAKSLLDQVTALQNADGSFDFSYDTFLGKVSDPYRRTGSLAWLGYAMVQYDAQTDDDTYREATTRLADYLLSLQVTTANGFSASDPRSGSILGGRGQYGSDGAYDYVDEPITWASTEHNIDAYFFLRDLGELADDDRYLTAAEDVKQSLLTNHWDAAHDRFFQGVSVDGPDPGRALDLVSWGGLFLLAVGEHDKAQAAAQQLAEFHVSGLGVSVSTDPDTYNGRFSVAPPLSGYKPYETSPGYDDPPSLIWSEGTWGALLLRLRLGEDITSDVQSLERLQDADAAGGLLQVTQTVRPLPYEFHAWPALAASAWESFVLDDSTWLWSADDDDGTPDLDGTTSAQEAAATAQEYSSATFDAPPAPAGVSGLSTTVAYVGDEPEAGFSLRDGDGELGIAPVETAPDATPALEVGDDTTVYANTAPSSDTFVRTSASGVETFTQIRAADAPKEYTWRVQAPAGSRLRHTAGGGAAIFDRDGRVHFSVSRPTAQDARGDAVPVTLAVHGDRVTLHVAHRSRDVQYPVMVDPSWEDTLTLGWSAGISRAPDPPGEVASCNDADITQAPSNAFTAHVSTAALAHGPSVRWAVKMKDLWLAILVSSGASLADISGTNWVQSAVTHRLVNQGGPHKRLVPLSYTLHSHIYRVHNVGYKHLRWGDYIQVYFKFRAETPDGVWHGHGLLYCEPRR